MCTLPEYFECLIVCDLLDFKCFPDAASVSGPTCDKNAARRPLVEKFVYIHTHIVIIVEN